MASTVTNSAHSMLIPSTYRPMFAVKDWNGPLPQESEIHSISGTASGACVPNSVGP